MQCGLATRKLSVHLSVRTSVRISVCQTRDFEKKTKVSSAQIFIPYERQFTIVFWEEEWLVERPLLPEIL